jgi:hypothetical protein
MALAEFADLQGPAQDATKKVYQEVARRIHDDRDPMPPSGALRAPERERQ